MRCSSGFYHQSFKVFGLQAHTEAIVRELEALSPGRPLNPWFVQILGEGTGKTFDPADNAALLYLYGLR